MDKLALFGGEPVRKSSIPYGKQYIDDDDIAAVIEALRAPYITTGPYVEKFEKKLCEITGAKYAVAISNGTAALHAACNAIGIKEGDEVIVSPITFAASANCVLYCGGTPVFADINEDTWNIDPDKIEEKITPRTKAIVAVDFTGQAVECDKIKKLCEKYSLKFIQDAAHSLGTKYNGVSIGNIADLTTFSFHPVKTITTGEGGAIMTNDPELYERMRLFRAHCITRDPAIMSQNLYNGYYEMIDLGYNYRLTDIQAALGLSQLNKLDAFSKRRKEIVEKYNEAFSAIPEIIVQKEIPESDTTRHLYIIRLNLDNITCDRGEFYKALNAEKIGLQVHYMPVYSLPYYQKLGYKMGQCPKAEALFDSIITLPLYYGMTNEDVDSIIAGVRKVATYYKK